ncbi:hypothetical protein DCAR_0521765 [Daucus carota subsp. sativus]|uniref:Enhancer of polycomb-like protein n=1 Tax=Daucus carota subsp. sativus TaxID=79200 RepID=A0AAF1B408_DAUCS|nr:hypothetical protein DCAR_0521765 [Daucus carota subsp. sativus]
MPVVRMRRSTRGFKVLRSGKRVWTDQLVEVGKKQPRKRARAKDKKVSAEKSVEEAPVLKDNEKVDDGFDMSREKIEMDVDEDTRKDSVKGREKPRGAVYVRKDKMGTVESPVSSTFGSFGVHKRRRNADGALPGDSSIGPDVFPCSSVESGQQAISSLVDNSITSVRKRKHSLPGLIENIDTSTCCTNILVIESDRCYRVEGAAFNLVKSDANQWFVAIEKDGTRRYDVIVQQVMRTCSFNRITHAVIWTCDNGWRLEFPNRRDWLIFKELYKECAEHNIKAPRGSGIPVPGVHEVPSYSQSSRGSFKRPHSYITWKDDELTRALAKETAYYDLDCEDELWLDKFNNESFQDKRINKHVSAAAFEQIINSFEKGLYCRQEDYSDVRIAVDLSLNLERKEVLEAVHNYWMRKRKQKKSALSRVFQCYQLRETHISAAVILGKKRSCTRQATRSGRGQQRTFSSIRRKILIDRIDKNRIFDQKVTVNMYVRKSRTLLKSHLASQRESD